MSFNTNDNWLYQIIGRTLHLYKKNTVNREYPALTIYSPLFQYPDEDITNGLQVEYTAMDAPFIKEAIESCDVRANGETISFSGSIISDSANGFGDFAVGDAIRIRGSEDGDNDVDAIVTGAVAGALTCSATTFTTETAGESITVFQIPAEETTPTETTHVNLDRLMCLAVVDYVKAKLASDKGEHELEMKLLRDFRGKIGDALSNKNNNRISTPKYPFALR